MNEKTKQSAIQSAAKELCIDVPVMKVKETAQGLELSLYGGKKVLWKGYHPIEPSSSSPLSRREKVSPAFFAGPVRGN